jgi:hypothetical protein
LIGNIQNIWAIPDPRKNFAIGESLISIGCGSGIYGCTIPAIAVATAAATK